MRVACDRAGQRALIGVNVAAARECYAALRRAGCYLYERLLRAGVRIYESQPTLIHQKIVVVDDTSSHVGSTNFDSRSLKYNAETGIGLLDPQVAAKLEGLSMRAWNAASS